MSATVAAADSAKVQKKYSVFIYSEAEQHAMYAIYKHTRTLCVLQYLYGKPMCWKLFDWKLMILLRLITHFQTFPKVTVFEVLATTMAKCRHLYPTSVILYQRHKISLN